MATGRNGFGVAYVPGIAKTLPRQVWAHSSDPLDYTALRGKRVGTTQWGSTAAVFMKGMIQDEYGVKPSDMHWFMGGLDAPTQAPLIPFTPPPGRQLHLLP